MQQVEVRFKINPKKYSFLSDFDLKRGDNVIVETSLGQSYGVVEEVSSQIDDTREMKKVIRKATEQDAQKHTENMEKEKYAILKAKEMAEALKLDINVVNAEYSFDGSKLLIDFIAENRVDFRDLVKGLASTLHTRIELHQVGVRDQARMVGGIGICGRECCCAAYLKDFEKVSIKMAKYQNLSLNPTKISGSCGRLMCCLAYEDPFYSEVYAKMPKVNSEVKTPDGVGTVVYQDMLKEKVSVKFTQEDGSSTIKDYDLDAISKKPADKKNNVATQNDKKKQGKKGENQPK